MVGRGREREPFLGQRAATPDGQFRGRDVDRWIFDWVRLVSSVVLSGQLVGSPVVGRGQTRGGERERERDRDRERSQMKEKRRSWTRAKEEEEERERARERKKEG